MTWRREGTQKERAAYPGEKNRRAFRKLVERGAARGVLALAEGKPVGWCSVGPHDDFPALERKRVLQTDRDAATWTITCFFVARPHRSRGVGVALAKEAARIAFAAGATRVEAFPAKLPASGTLPDTFAWTGTASLFRRAGFAPLPSNPRVFIRT